MMTNYLNRYYSIEFADGSVCHTSANSIIEAIKKTIGKRSPDSNRTIVAIEIAKEQEVNDREIEKKILAVVDKWGDPLMEHFIEELKIDREVIARVAISLVHRGVLRQKEDEQDHDWSYRWNAPEEERAKYR